MLIPKCVYVNVNNSKDLEISKQKNYPKFKFVKYKLKNSNDIKNCQTLGGAGKSSGQYEH